MVKIEVKMLSKKLNNGNLRCVQVIIRDNQGFEV